MQDLPVLDNVPKIRNLIDEIATDLLPAEAKALILKGYPHCFIKSYISVKELNWSHPVVRLYKSPAPGGSSGSIDLAKFIQNGPAEKVEELNRLVKEQVEGNERVRRLRSQVEGLANSCTTIKSLKDAAPEFAKYLPQELPPSSNLPAVAGIVDGFRAAGWPKSGVAPSGRPAVAAK